MTDTTPPAMTPEQRDELVDNLRKSPLSVIFTAYAADQLEADGVTIATLAAERDEAQDRAYSLAVAIMGGEDAPGLADSLPTETLETLARSNFQRHSEDIDRLTAAQAEIARLTAAIATAREGGMREAAQIAIGRKGSGALEMNHPYDRGYLAACDHIATAITKGAAT